MTIQTYENKGDLYICIKGAPAETKKKLESLFADVCLKELKGLVSAPEETNKVVADDGWKTVGPECTPWGTAIPDSDPEPNENLPFKKKTEQDAPVEKSKYDPFA